jgi:hypothetical protein
MKARLHVLVIGIDEYSFAPLRGCVNDASAFKDYLEKIYPVDNPSFELNITDILLNETATRQAIIDSFEKFRQAADGDFCVFYYSGHGSSSFAPEEFWTETDRLDESLVCYDSRLPGGKDLIDKELAFLLWKAGQGKKLNFIVIIDCCHSGNITKDADAYARNRGASPDYTPRTIEEYYGYGDSVDGKACYKEALVGGKRRVTVAVVPHLLLAACRDKQTAKELEIDGRIGGVFTHALLRSLYETNGMINYEELEYKIGIYVKALAADQMPAITANNLPAYIRSQIFLDTKPGGHEIPYTLSYNMKYDRWEVNGGVLQGINVNDEVILQGTAFPIIKAYADYALIMPLGLSLDTTQGYALEVRRQPNGRTNAQISTEADPEGAAILRSEWSKRKGSLLELTAENPRYIIRARNNTYSLCLPNDEKPLFDPVEDAYNENGAAFFLSSVEKLCKWQAMLNLQNPGQRLTTGQDVVCRLTVLKYPGQYADEDEASTLASSCDAELYYRKEGEEWWPPAMRIAIINQSLRAPCLYLNALILQWDYAILAPFEPIEIQSGEEHATQLRFINDEGYAQETLPFGVPDRLLQKGINSTMDYVKIFVSTQPIDVGGFAQTGLGMANKDFVVPGKLTAPDWTCFTIGVRTIHPGSVILHSLYKTSDTQNHNNQSGDQG